MALLADSLPAPTPGDMVRSLAFYLVFYSGTLVFVFASLAALLAGRGPFMAAVRQWSRFHRSCMRAILRITIRVEGAPPACQSIVALKHESFVEAIDLPALLDCPVVFAKAELLRIPFWGRAAALYGVVAVERDQGASALRSMIAAARKTAGEGRHFAIFPEGTRMPHGESPPLQAGFAGLYKLLGLPVVPAAVDSGRLYHRRWKRPGTIVVRFGEPIPPGMPRAEAEARVHAAINALNTG